MIRAIIIDDEKQARNVVRGLAEANPNIDIIGEANGVEAGLELIRQSKPNIVFLDVEMDDGTGFDLLDQIGKVDFKVIFTTSHNAFMLRAIRYSALDYLLKPVGEEEFNAAVDRYEPDNYGQDLLNNLVQSIQQKETSKRIALYTNGEYQFVKIDDIISIQSDHKYCRVFTNTAKLFVSKSIKEFEQILDPEQFVRVHREYIVNKEFIKLYNKEGNGEITLYNGQIILISRRRKQLVEEALLK